MPKLRVANFSISLDGFGAGPRQRREEPLGKGGERLHDWVVATRSWRAAHGQEGGVGGVDNQYAASGFAGVGATIMGRNMFGPIRGPWEDDSWKGWWGDDPPFHHDVLVLTHHPRASVGMAGGTTFHFVDGSPESVLERAFAAAGGKDVLVGGGASTIRQFLRAGLIDEMHIVIVPVLLGDGARLFEDLADVGQGYECTGMVSSRAATHVTIARRGA